MKHGIPWFFCGPFRHWNIFDCIFVVVGIFEVVFDAVSSEAKTKRCNDSEHSHVWRLVRLLRLARIVRLIRLLRYKAFSELRSMVEGVVTGFRIIVWAMVLLFVFIYVVTLTILITFPVRQLLLIDTGATEKERGYTFGNIIWLMFTLFRCFTDGCNALDGKPLHAHFALRFGPIATLGYVVTYLFVTIGIFNLIMATFIDYVMTASSKRRQYER